MTTHSLALALFQDQLTSNDVHLIMYAVMVMAGISLIQFAAFAFGAAKMLGVVNEMKAKVHELHGSATPVLTKANDMLADLKPKVATISENVVQLSYTARLKAEEIGETVTKVNRTVLEVNQTVADANMKTRSQVGHVNAMVNTALDSTEKLTNTMVQGINIPVKQAAGIIAGLKTTYETLIKNFQGTGPKPFGFGRKGNPDRFDY